MLVVTQPEKAELRLLPKFPSSWARAPSPPGVPSAWEGKPGRTQQPQANQVTTKVSSCIRGTWLSSTFAESEAGRSEGRAGLTKAGSLSTLQPQEVEQARPGPTDMASASGGCGQHGAGAGVLMSPRIIDSCVSVERGDEIKASCSVEWRRPG